MTEQTACFASDNASGIHASVLESIQRANTGYALAYGRDDYTARATQVFREVFGEDTAVFFVGTGTATNVLSLKAAAASTDAVFCSDLAHLYVDECSAPEHFVGCKMVPLKSHAGKVDITTLRAALAWQDDPIHRNRARLLSLTEATEYGTLYSIAELRELISFAHERGLKVHMDGARVANAAAALKVSLKALTRDLGVDILSFGGTKNGLMMAESVVIFDPTLAPAFQFIRKQGMQLASKNRFYAAQYLAYFEDELWRKNAEHANAMGAYLAERLAGIDGVQLSFTPQVNMVFAHVQPGWLEALERHAAFELWDPATCEIRLVTSFDTTRELVDTFVDEVRRIAARAR